MNNEEKEYTLISNILPIGAVVFAVVIILGVIFIKQPDKEYQISDSEMLKKLLSYEQTIGPDKVVDILFEKDSLYRFIDLRSTPDFINGHIEGAINIPISHIFDDKYEKILNQDKKINILYYSDHCGACGPWMILSQLGYKNNKILLGGYDYVNEHILKSYAPLSGNYKNEKAHYDYAKVISETAGAGSSVKTSSPTKPTTPPVKKKKKEVAEDGGC
jgi:rhodanese-related sulfurtransferase